MTSGLRRLGSSSGSASWTMRDFEPARRTTMSASSRIDVSLGLPRLIGPVTRCGVFISPTRPSTRSST